MLEANARPLESDRGLVRRVLLVSERSGGDVRQADPRLARAKPVDLADCVLDLGGRETCRRPTGRPSRQREHEPESRYDSAASTASAPSSWRDTWLTAKRTSARSRSPRTSAAARGPHARSRPSRGTTRWSPGRLLVTRHGRLGLLLLGLVAGRSSPLGGAGGARSWWRAPPEAHPGGMSMVPTARTARMDFFMVTLGLLGSPSRQAATREHRVSAAQAVLGRTRARRAEAALQTGTAAQRAQQPSAAHRRLTSSAAHPLDGDSCSAIGRNRASRDPTVAVERLSISRGSSRLQAGTVVHGRTHRRPGHGLAPALMAHTTELDLTRRNRTGVQTAG